VPTAAPTPSILLPLFLQRANWVPEIWISCCLFAATILVIVSIVPKSASETSKQFAASFLLIALAIEANYPWVYGVSIFIIAYLIADASFLENLAAISWNRAWWISSKARASEIAAKRQQEARELAADGRLRTEETLGFLTDAERRGGLSEAAREFEEEVFAKLAEIFPKPFLRKEIALTRLGSGGRVRIIIDAVAEIGNDAYVIEIKLSTTRMEQTYRQVADYINAYSEMLSERRKYLHVRGVIVIPSESDVPPLRDQEIRLLRFDQGTHEFTNVREFEEWMGS